MNEHVALPLTEAHPVSTTNALRAPSSVQRRGRANRQMIAWVLLLAAVLGACAVWLMSRAGSTVSYASAPVDRGAITRTVIATGMVNPVLTVTVGSYVSGVIQEVLCDFNTQVKKGQVCARIDPRPFQSQVDQNKANLDVAKAQLDKDNASLTYAQLNYQRNEQLAKRQAVTQDVADSAKSAQDQAQAQVAVDQATIEQRQAALEAAQLNLDYTEITSPVDGIVVLRNVTLGQTVAASFQTPTVFLIAQDLTKMQVDTNSSESDIGSIKEGERAIFTVDAFPSLNFEGAVAQVRVAPQTVQNVVTYDVVVQVSNADFALKPGMTASVRIVVDERKNAIRVPNQALRFRPSTTLALPVPPIRTGGQAAGVAANGSGDRSEGKVWVLRDGQPQPIVVTTGLDDGRYTEILTGEIKPGDQVITGEDQALPSSTQSQPRLRL
jgi:HlyD family secretion protein